MRNESGRSMVEMLGVLAIIGVLSIGGIAGYTTAMNKYRANENLATGSQCVILAQSDNGGEGIAVNATVNCKTDYDLNVRDGITMTVEKTSANAFTLHIDDETVEVCKQMHNAFPQGADPYELDCPTTTAS